MIHNIKNDYFTYSKNIVVSLLFITPFIFLYEIICFFYFKNTLYQIRNSADIVLRNIFDYFGNYSEIAYSISLLASLLFIYFINKENKKIDIRYLYFM